jgi:hypothetical protein
MIIPDSIANITTEKSSDVLLTKIQGHSTDYDRIVHLLRQQLSLDQFKKFEEGYTFYKTSADANQFIKIIITLYITAYIQALKHSEILDDDKKILVNIYENTLKTSTAFLDTIHAMNGSFKNIENIIDLQSISSIILGYATKTLRQSTDTKKQ